VKTIAYVELSRTISVFDCVVMEMPLQEELEVEDQPIIETGPK
jgi:hypothetical protein